MSIFLTEQFTSIINTSDAKINYKNNFENITNNIIPSINSQLKRYEVDSNEAIKTEILQELMEETDFASLKQQVINDLKNGIVNRFEHVSFRPVCEHHISLVDVSKLAQPDNDTSEMRDHLTLTLQMVREFEDNMCSYKLTLKKYIKECIPNLVTKYESVIRKSLKNKSTFPKLDQYISAEINRILDA